MKIGIDISQLAYQNTGVANYLKHLVSSLIENDKENEYVLFGSSLRQSNAYQVLSSAYRERKNVAVKVFKFPPSLLNILWNKLHILPIEDLIGDVDVFITSDWTEPPAKKAKKMTIIYDLIVYKYPEETADKIVTTQKRKLQWVKRESDMILCISEATKKDVSEILGIPDNKLTVIHGGI